MRSEGDSPEGNCEWLSRLLTCYAAARLVVHAAPLSRMVAVVTTTLFGFAHTALGSKSELTSYQPILLVVQSTG